MFSARSSVSRQGQFLEEAALEGKLFAMLNPVQANPEFISGLKSRLTRPPAVTVENRSDVAAVVIGLGLFAGVFLTWAVFLIRHWVTGRRTD